MYSRFAGFAIATTLIVVFTSCQPVPSFLLRPAVVATMASAPDQQEADNLAVVRRFYEEFGAGNPQVILDVHPETLTINAAGVSDYGLTQLLYEDLAALKVANPDLHAEIHDMFAAGDYVFTELTWSGTHTGEFFGIPATGNPVMHSGIVVRRLEDGKIVESWEMWDDLTFLNTLGLSPGWDEIVGGAEE